MFWILIKQPSYDKRVAEEDISRENEREIEETLLLKFEMWDEWERESFGGCWL